MNAEFIERLEKIKDDKVIQYLSKTIVSSAFISFAGMGLSFLMGVQLAHLLKVEGYGIYGFVMSITAILITLSQCGLPQLLTREIAAANVNHNGDHIRRLIRWTTKVCFGLSLLVMIPAIVWVVFNHEPIDSTVDLTMVAGFATIPLAAQLGLKCATLRGLNAVLRSPMLDNILQPALMALMLLLLSYYPALALPSIAMVIRVLSFLLVLLVAFVLLYRLVPSSDKQQSEVSFASRPLWTIAVPMAMTENLRVLQGNFLTVVVGLIATASSVGIYKIACSIILLVGVPQTIVNLIISPMISQAFTQKNLQQLTLIMRFSTVAISLGVALLTIPFFVHGQWLLETLFGEGFGPANELLLIMSTGMLISSLLGPNVVLLNMCHQERAVAKIYAISFVVMLLLAAPMVIWFDTQGAAITYSLSIMLCAGMLKIYAKKLLKSDWVGV